MNKVETDLISQVLMIGVDQNTPGGMAAVVKTYGIYYKRMKYISTWRVGNYFVKSMVALRAIIITFIYLLCDKKIKIIHIHVAANASFYRKSIFIKLGKFFKKKVILHVHAADFVDFFDASKDQNRIINTISICDKLVVLSKSWKEYFESIGISKSKIEILNNIIPPPIKLDIEPDNDHFKLLFLGEIGKRKGVYDILEVLKKDKNYYSDKLILKIGGNLEEEKLVQTIKQFELGDFVKFEGWVRGTKKVECLNWADVVMLPSYNEGLPIAILESMSYGLPVISTNVGGIPEILFNHRNGILIKPGHQDELESSIRFFIENREKVNEYGVIARETIKEFLAETVIKKLNQLYISLIVSR